MSDQNRAIIQHAWTEFASHDPNRIAAVLTDDAEWLAPPRNATAQALNAPSHMIGKQAITHFLSHDFPRLFTSDVTVTFHAIHADPTSNHVIVEETMTATLPNGTHYTNDYCLVFQLRDGLIHRVREYLDTARGHHSIFAGHPPASEHPPAYEHEPMLAP